MVFESLVAAYIYTGAITYLHHDGLPKTTASIEAQPQIPANAFNYYEEQDNWPRPAPNEKIDPADLKGESIWAKDEGTFDDWAK